MTKSEREESPSKANSCLSSGPLDIDRGKVQLINSNNIHCSCTHLSVSNFVCVCVCVSLCAGSGVDSVAVKSGSAPTTDTAEDILSKYRPASLNRSHSEQNSQGQY